MSLGLVYGLGVLLAVAVIWRYWHYRSGLDWQIRKLTRRLDSLSRRQSGVVAKQRIMKDLYHILFQSMNQQCLAVTYQAIDLLKLAFGEGLGQGVGRESQRLSACIIGALRWKEADVAGQLTDGFKPLLRRLTVVDTPQTLRQMGFIAAVALKDRQNFIAAKLVDLLFTVLEKMDSQAIESRQAAFRALKLIGVMALRRHDVALFREVLARLYVWIGRVPLEERSHLCADMGALLFVSWLHRIIQSDNSDAFDALTETMERLTTDGVFAQGILALVAEWRDMGGAASMQIRSDLGERLIRKILELAVRSGEKNVWSSAIKEVIQIVALNFSQRTLREAFSLVRPVLETGRELLAAELRFRTTRESTDFFRQALQQLLQECLILAEYLSRQDMTSTAGDVIEEMHGLWSGGQRKNGAKYKKRFCQVLLFYWIQTSRRKSRRSLDTYRQLMEPLLISEQEQRQLIFLTPFPGVG